MAYFAFGALTTLSFAPFDLYFMMPAFLMPLMFAWFYLPPRNAAKLSFWYGSGLFLSGTYWLYISIHVFGQAPLWVALIIMIGLVLLMAAYCAAAGWIISRLVQGHARRLLLVAPAGWVAIEWLRGWFLSGFPWLAVGYSQIDSSLAGWAPLLGIYGVSAVTVLISAALLVAVVETGRMRWLTAGVVVLPWVVGAALQPIQWTQASDKPLRTTIVQGGVSQDRKWMLEEFEPTLTLYHKSLLAHDDSDLVVWPEVAIPSVIDPIEG